MKWESLEGFHAALYLGLGRAFLPTLIVGFFNSAFQPHLDQMQHTPAYDAPRERLHQFGVRNAAEVIGEVGVDDVRLASKQVVFYRLSVVLP